jgi:3-dehydroquinate synthase
MNFLIEEGLFTSGHLVELIRPLGHFFAIITDEAVAQLYGEALLERLRTEGLIAYLFSFPPGEKNKTRETKQQLEDAMIAKGFGTDSCVIALGGGVVSDLAGFLASTFCRGVPFVNIPTTLLSMIDACIGGKNGVNACGLKNRIGTIYPAALTAVDPYFLKNLPPSLLKEGSVEMIKHGLIADRELFFLLKASPQEICHSEIIKRNILIKQKIVEKGIRAVLNFGHTIGHAVESDEMSHGNAVAFGIIAESYISHLLGLLPKSDLTMILEILKDFNFSPLPPHREIIQRMRQDKKTEKGVIHMALLQSIGLSHQIEGRYSHPIDEKQILEGINYAIRITQ